MVFQYQNNGTEENSTENYCHADFWEPRHWPGSKELCFIPSFAIDSLHDSGQLLPLKHSFHHPQKGMGSPCLSAGSWDQESVIAGRNLVKVVINSLWILQGKRSCTGHLCLVKCLFTPWDKHLSSQLLLNQTTHSHQQCCEKKIELNSQQSHHLAKRFQQKFGLSKSIHFQELAEIKPCHLPHK